MRLAGENREGVPIERQLPVKERPGWTKEPGRRAQWGLLKRKIRLLGLRSYCLLVWWWSEGMCIREAPTSGTVSNCGTEDHR